MRSLTTLRKVRKPFLAMLLALGSTGTVYAGFDEQFVYKYTDLNTGNWGHRYFEFNNSDDRVNAFNRSVSLNIPIGKRYNVNADFSTQMNLHYGSNIWDWKENNGVVSAVPWKNYFSAGLGFNLGFGQLIEPSNNPYGQWVYERADGKIVRFYDNFNGETPVAGVYYSHDSQKLRLKQVSVSQLDLEFTNGEVYRFRKHEGQFLLHKRSDQFGNYQTFNYDSANNRVTTADNHGRIQWIHFKADPTGHYPRLVDKIRLTKPGGVQVYTFNYSTLMFSAPAEDNDSSTPASVTLPVLTSISYPLGKQLTFTYHDNSNVGAGRLSSYTNTWGGRIDYTYADVSMPLVQNPANLNQTMDHFAADVVGVATRTAIDVNGSNLGAWTFSTKWHGGTRNTAPSLIQPTGMKSVMFRPDGYRDMQYFRVPVKDIVVTSPEAHTSDKSEYGYPGLVNDWTESLEQLVKDTQNRYVERRRTHFSCDDCLDPVTTVTHVVSQDVGGYAKREVFSGLDWAGRPTVSQLLNNWTEAGRTTYERDTTVPGVNERWLLKPATRVTTSIGNHSKTYERCVNDLGQVTRSRQWVSDNRSSHDYVQNYLYDSQGNKTETRYFGGDGQAVATGSLCSIALNTPQFREFSHYAFGTESRAGFLNTSGSVFSEKFSKTIDVNTGLVSKAHSGDGLNKLFAYDSLNRTTSVVPESGGGARVTNAFTLPQNGSGAASDQTITSQNGQTTFSRQLKNYDGFGRVIETKKLGPAGWAVTSSTWDAMGRKTTDTNEYGGVTQYLNHDYKGRVGIIRPPEGAQHDVTFTYLGDRQRVQQVSIAKDLTVNPPVEQYRTFTYDYDLFGRTTGETLSDQDGFVRNRTTAYDLNGNWLSKTEGSTTLTNQEVYNHFGQVIQNSYGSPVSYNALGQPLVKYNDFGEAIDLVYDAAGRLVHERVGGVNYKTFNYATVNTSGQYNKGKLVSAVRLNEHVDDIHDHVFVTDRFEYAGVGGLLSKRTTEIATSSEVLFSGESTQTLTPDFKVQTLSTTPCVATARFLCSIWQAQRSLEYSYDHGRLTSVWYAGDQLSSPVFWLSNAQYTAQGDLLSYRSGNGLTTELTWSPDVDEPDTVTVKNGGSVLWQSGTAFHDGNDLVTHRGLSLAVPADFYTASTLTPQAAAYEFRPPNESALYDALGELKSTTFSGCKVGNLNSVHPACFVSNVRDAWDDVVWYRKRPKTWGASDSPELISELYLKDAQDNQSTVIQGGPSYTFADSHRLNPVFNKVYSNYLFNFEVYGQGRYLGEDIEVSNETGGNRYLHIDMKSGRFGESNREALFTSDPSF